MVAAAGEQRQGEPRGGGGEQRQDEPRGGGSGGASHEVAAAAGQTAWWRWRQRWFFLYFSIFLPSVGAQKTLGKVFAERPIKNTRQRNVCRLCVRRVLFTECNTRQRLCQVFFGLRRVSWAHGKLPHSSSETYTYIKQHYKKYVVF